MTDEQKAERAAWMGLLARSQPSELARLMPALPPHDTIRAPEIGTTMIRGRAGATGAAFNLGEMTVTRCAVRLASGVEGHGYVQGRDKAHARNAALIDALMQGPEAGALRAAVLAPLQASATARTRARAGEAAATKVEFFTMVRGE